jgi:hypothetical protein
MTYDLAAIRKNLRRLKNPLCCFHFDAKRGGADFAGRIVDETETAYHVEVVDACFAFCGLWEPTGDVMEFSKDECVVFNDQAQCLKGFIVVGPDPFN